VYHPHLDPHAQQYPHAPHPVSQKGGREGGKEGGRGEGFYQGPPRVSLLAEAMYHPHPDPHAQKYSHASHPVREEGREGGREGNNVKSHKKFVTYLPPPHSLPPSLPE